jgi:hypothetical protein
MVKRCFRFAAPIGGLRIYKAKLEIHLRCVRSVLGYLEYFTRIWIGDREEDRQSPGRALMWFVIRTAFCIGVVYSLTPDAEVAGDARAVASSLVEVAAPAVRNAMEDAAATCTREPKLCLEAAQLLASAKPGSAGSAPHAILAEGEHVVADTLTAADRSAPWHGAGEASGSGRVRAILKPAP